MHLSYLQFGHIHIPIYGIFAALGIMAALGLSQRTAGYAHIAPETVWNAGVTAILCAFVISRLLLIAFNLHSFLQYPLLVVTLPSLTITGILLTAIAMFGYLRWRKIPLLPLLDAVSPCAPLLWAFLSLGLYFEGTRDGMPMHPLSGRHDLVTSRLYPVELTTALAALLLSLRVLSTLKKQHAKPRGPRGVVTSITLVASGFILFFLDFYRLPSELFDRAPLDPSQIIGVAMILVGTALFVRALTGIERESGNEPPNAI